MTLSDTAEEILESLWAELVEHKKPFCDTTLLKDDSAFKDLVKYGTENLILKMADLKPNECGHVAYLQTHDKGALQKLMAMGILPGTEITLLQRYPTFVFQSGKTQFAVDKALASHVFVRRQQRTRK
ncbi:MAG: FeoA family protein [bacterium]